MLAKILFKKFAENFEAGNLVLNAFAIFFKNLKNGNRIIIVMFLKASSGKISCAPHCVGFFINWLHLKVRILRRQREKFREGQWKRSANVGFRKVVPKRIKSPIDTHRWSREKSYNVDDSSNNNCPFYSCLYWFGADFSTLRIVRE